MIGLSNNPSDEIFELLKANIHLINTGLLSANKNPKVLELLKQYPYKIDWNIIWSNPSIFEKYYDTELLQKYTNMLLKATS